MLRTLTNTTYCGRLFQQRTRKRLAHESSTNSLLRPFSSRANRLEVDDPFEKIHGGIQRPVSDLDLPSRHQLRLPGRSIIPVGHENLPAPLESRLVTRNLDELVEPTSLLSDFPYNSDVCVLGGGLIGASIAYYLGQHCWQGSRIALIERDFEHRLSVTGNGSGQLHGQHALPETLQLSSFSANFLRHAHQLLATPDLLVPDSCYHPLGRLMVVDERYVHRLYEQQQLQQVHGVQCELVESSELAARYPWLSTSGVLVGAYCGENAGWYDTAGVTRALLARAERCGVAVKQGEVVGVKRGDSEHDGCDDLFRGETIDSVIVRQADGRLERASAASFVLACGANSGCVAELADIGVCGENMLGIPLPIRARKRYTYRLHIPDGPGIDCPLLVSSTGLFLRRVGLHEQFVCSCEPPSLHHEPDPNSLHVQPEYFEEHVRPALVRLVPSADNATVLESRAHLVDHNDFDDCPIVGFHPHYTNLFIATGFGDRAAQMAPAIGRAVYESIYYHKYSSIDLTRFGFNRIVSGSQLFEARCG